MAFVRVASTSEVQEGSVKTVHTRVGRIALTRLAGEILAFEDVCTHDDGSLAGGEVSGEVVTCPRHGAQFSMRTGEVLKMPATEGIETFTVRIQGDDVEVEVV